MGLSPRKKQFRLTGGLAGDERILFVDSGSLTDLVFFLPVIESIRDRWPGVSITIMVQEEWADLLRGERGLEGIILYSSEQLRIRSTAYHRLLREIKGRCFDTVVLMGSVEDPFRDLVAYASGAPLRVGIETAERESILNCTLRWRNRDRYRMGLAREIGRILGIDYETNAWRMSFRADELRAADQLIHFRKPRADQLLIGVDPGSGLESNRLAESHLAYLASHLGRSLRAKILVFQLHPDAEAREAFRRRLQVESLDIPKISLRETLALLSRCGLFIGGNTELFHSAVACGVPSIGMYTEVDGLEWEPRERPGVAILRGRPGEKLSLKELDEEVGRILHAPAS